MPCYVKPHNTVLLLAGWLLLPAPGMAANPFAAHIRHASVVESDDTASITASIDYSLSPVAREALHKGIALSWNLLYELRRPGWLWDSVLYHGQTAYTLQFHALLNQYAVRINQSVDMFLSLQAALNYMAYPKLSIPASRHDQSRPMLAVKLQFNRESLPIPLRPMAYLDEQWFLSSDWTTWSTTE